MKKFDINELVVQNILRYTNEGTHVIDKDGKTIMYNEAMAQLEGIERAVVIDKQLLEIFPSLDEDTSTLLTVMKTGRPIIDRIQTYFNYKGEKITAINTTIPLFKNGSKIGALEIAKDVTKIKELSEQVVDLQQELITKGKEEIKKRKPMYTFDNIVGNSIEIKKSIEIARKASMTPSSVLIYGETGTGKELFAQSIHYTGIRKNKPFIAQNCAALPESLLEGILFGTVKGGFTGAIDRPGLFEQANGGTLLLDEINSMGLILQAKLLRVLQEGYIRRVGGLKDIPIDVKIIATTNEKPLLAIEQGKLRKDLFYRLNVISVEIPSLKDRIEDLNLLCDHFIRKYNKKLNKDVWMVSQEVYSMFQKYEWAGNVRELENVIHSTINYISNDEHVIKKESLPNYINDFSIKRNSNKALRYKDMENSLPDVLEEIEREIIIEKLRESNFNITRAAGKLKIRRQTLQHKLKKYNIKL